jgi:hypothetical protein
MVALLLMFQPGCKKEHPGQTDIDLKTSVERPQANGVSVIAYITEMKDYRQWPFFPNKGTLYPGKHPHGSLLVTYVSPETLIALQNNEARLPDGTIIVKENYNLQKKLQTTTVMYRIDGYNPENGDWFWLEYTPDQTVLKEGKAEGCINCHRAVKSNDWIFSGPVN